jgi:photosystem II oxygen-evolving enhancer protein 1
MARITAFALLGSAGAFVTGPGPQGAAEKSWRQAALRAQPLSNVEFSQPTETPSSWNWAASVIGLGAMFGMAIGLVGPKSANAVTAEQFSQLTYAQVKGSGLANRCPTVDQVGEEVPVKEGARLINVCFEPKSFAVEADTDKGKRFVTTRLVTRQTYSLEAIVGDLKTNPISFKEEDGMDFQAVTVKLPDGELVPFLFSMKGLEASGEGSSFKPGYTWGGEYNVPSYRTGGFLDPKARGMTLGYDQAVALPALQADGKAGQEELFNENNKVFDLGKGAVEMEVNKVNQPLGEIGGVFVAKQPSDTDMGSKAPKTMLLKGIFYGKVV